MNMNPLSAFAAMVVAILMLAAGPVRGADTNAVFHIVSTADEPMVPGKFAPTWDSLKQYQCPDWFRDAKFGIWAHWTAQCVPEQGDWYARNLYMEGSADYKYHLEHYGPPSKIGFKDIDYIWRAEK